MASRKPEWIYRQSAVVPIVDGKIVMITSRRKKRWIVPKGIVEPNMSPAESAAQEALEEAGLLGKLRPESIGTYRYEKWGGTCTVEVFVLDVVELLDDWEERRFREREIVSVDEAASRVDEPELQRIIRDKFGGVR